MIDKIDTIWVLFSVVLVMLMIPGLAFFYGGLIRQKNVLSTLMHSFFMLVWHYTLVLKKKKFSLNLFFSDNETIRLVFTSFNPCCIHCSLF